MRSGCGCCVVAAADDDQTVSDGDIQSLHRATVPTNACRCLRVCVCVCVDRPNGMCEGKEKRDRDMAGVGLHDGCGGGCVQAR